MPHAPGVGHTPAMDERHSTSDADETETLWLDALIWVAVLCAHLLAGTFAFLWYVQSRW